MGRRLAQRGGPLSLIVASPAERARETAELVAAELGYDCGRILYQQSLYDAGLTELQEVVQGLDDRHVRALLIGHNPGITLFANYLCAEAIDHLPTAAVVEIELALQRWRETERGAGVLRGVDYPKLGRDDDGKA